MGDQPKEKTLAHVQIVTVLDTPLSHRVERLNVVGAKALTLEGQSSFKRVEASRPKDTVPSRRLRDTL